MEHFPLAAWQENGAEYFLQLHNDQFFPISVPRPTFISTNLWHEKLRDRGIFFYYNDAPYTERHSTTESVYLVRMSDSGTSYYKLFMSKLHTLTPLHHYLFSNWCVCQIMERRINKGFTLSADAPLPEPRHRSLPLRTCTHSIL